MLYSTYIVIRVNEKKKFHYKILVVQKHCIWRRLKGLRIFWNQLKSPITHFLFKFLILGIQNFFLMSALHGGFKSLLLRVVLFEISKTIHFSIHPSLHKMRYREKSTKKCLNFFCISRNLGLYKCSLVPFMALSKFLFSMIYFIMNFLILPFSMGFKCAVYKIPKTNNFS